MTDATALVFSHRARCAGPKTILHVGDSRTAQLNWQYFGRSTSPYCIANFGIAGATVASYLEFLQDELTGQDLGHPYGAVINLGTNDIWTPKDSDEWRDFNLNYRDIIIWFASRGCRIALCTLTPMEKGFPNSALDWVPRADDICARIRGMATTYGVPVVEYNYSARISDHTAMKGTTLDGLHLSEAAAAAHWGIASSIVTRYFT